MQTAINLWNSRSNETGHALGLAHKGNYSIMAADPFSLGRALMRKLAMFVMVILAMTALEAAAQQTERVPQPATDAQRAQLEMKRQELAIRDALRGLDMGTLTMPQAIATAGGRLPLNVAPNLDEFRLPDLQAVVGKSRIVVVARPIGSPTVHLTEDGRGVVSRYIMQIDEAVRGERDAPVRAGSQIAVDLPGGVMTFGEGVVDAVGGVDLKQGQTYMLFLQRLEDRLPPDVEGRRPATTRASDAPFVVTGYHYEGLFAVEGANARSLVASTFVQFKEKQDQRSLRSLVDEVKAVK